MKLPLEQPSRAKPTEIRVLQLRVTPSNKEATPADD